jgi:MFS family permease
MGAFLPSRNAVFAQFGAGMGMGRVFGISMGVSTVMNSISPVLFGFLADQLGLRISMRLFAIPAFIGCLIAVYLAISNRRRLKGTSTIGKEIR